MRRLREGYKKTEVGIIPEDWEVKKIGDIVNIKSDGKVDLEHLKSLLRSDTILVSICYVDSEVGTVQPIQEIVNILKDYPNCFLHVDATQAIGKIKTDFNGVDLVSFAPHKFNGLNGFGCLLKQKNIGIKFLLTGICNL